MNKLYINPNKKPAKKTWKSAFSFGNLKMTIGLVKENGTSSLLAEVQRKKGNLLFIDKYALQQIKNGDKMRIACHKQNKILEKLPDGQ